jgi:hypothetical protein
MAKIKFASQNFREIKAGKKKIFATKKSLKHSKNRGPFPRLARLWANNSPVKNKIAKNPKK